MMKLKKVKGLQESVCGALMRLEGPGCLIRDVNKRLKGVLTGELRQELIKLSNEGFGGYEEVCRKNGKTFIFTNLLQSLCRSMISSSKWLAFLWMCTWPSLMTSLNLVIS